MPRTVISNTSPLLYLHQIGQLNLLENLYGEIVVPQAVVSELTAGRDLGEDVPDVSNCAWIEVRTVRFRNL